MRANSKLPNHIVKQYGSSRAFRAHKRKLVKHMHGLLSVLRLGAAYFPDGGNSVDRIDYELKALANQLSVKNWGQ